MYISSPRSPLPRLSFSWFKLNIRISTSLARLLFILTAKLFSIIFSFSIQVKLFIIQIIYDAYISIFSFFLMLPVNSFKNQHQQAIPSFLNVILLHPRVLCIIKIIEVNLYLFALAQNLYYVF